MSQKALKRATKTRPFKTVLQLRELDQVKPVVLNSFLHLNRNEATRVKQRSCFPLKSWFVAKPASENRWPAG
jgi:hypothetical protein